MVETVYGGVCGSLSVEEGTLLKQVNGNEKSFTLVKNSFPHGIICFLPPPKSSQFPECRETVDFYCACKETYSCSADFSYPLEMLLK